MILVMTTGAGSMDRYSQHLAAGMPEVQTLQTDIYGRIAECFNEPWLSATALRTLWTDFRFARLLNRISEPVHLPNHHLGRYALGLTVPHVITVHDLIRFFDISRVRPLIHTPNRRDRFYLHRDYAGIRHATAIIAVSHTTRYDLIEHLGVPEDRVHVVYEGVDHQQFHPVAPADPGFPYLLYVGSEHPRKNLGEILHALRELKDSGIAPDLKLIKVGRAGGAEDDFRANTREEIRRLDLGDSVVFAGRIDDDELNALYAGALCSILPSLYEGFGLPVLEAMAAGSPVIVSSGGSLPEVAGDAGIIVSPRDPHAMAGAITSIVTCPERRHDFVQRGLARAAEFSWERMARETRAVYDAIEADYQPARRLGEWAPGVPPGVVATPGRGAAVAPQAGGSSGGGA